MNKDIKDINFNLDSLKGFYNQNKNFLIPIFVIFTGIILMVFFVIPQVNGFFQKQGEIQSEQQKLTNLQNSLSVLTSTQDSSLDQDITLTSAALPADKDFASVMNSISNAAASSQVSLGDFEFQIGDISKNTDLGASTPSLKITLNITGDVNSTIKFVQALYSSVPIAEVQDINSASNFSTIQAIFYFKPFPPQGSTNPENIKAITAKDQDIINSIKIPSSFDENTLESLGAPVSTSSGL